MYTALPKWEAQKGGPPGALRYQNSNRLAPSMVTSFRVSSIPLPRGMGGGPTEGVSLLLKLLKGRGIGATPIHPGLSPPPCPRRGGGGGHGAIHYRGQPFPKAF